MPESKAIQTIGILGGGQLAMMLAEAAKPLGLACVALDPDPTCPASYACEVIVGAYTDPGALDRLAARCDAVTYEFENVPVESAQRIAERKPVYPDPTALETAQDRLNERRMFERLGIGSPAMRAVSSLEELIEAAVEIDGPAILKSRREGYDGKGQSILRSPDDAERAWIAVGRVPAILDRMVSFERELSVIATRARDGSTVVYPLNENQHANGILCVTRAPAVDAERLKSAGEGAARAILMELDYVGTLAVEFFQIGTGADAALLANEIAPRVHNTGHWTIEGARTSQFENHMRAVAGMELGPPHPLGHAAMVNIIGTHESGDARQAHAEARWHDYHKQARPGRKLGHVTVVESTPAERDRTVRTLLDAVMIGGMA
ncbi:MAG: 5-(carboxyamino)imidazole ribonucleotide synthase [Planctomycetota bacterium]